MNEIIGDLLPLAVGVAISPIPIIAAILMLLAAKAGGTSVGFLLGWVAGIAVATGVFTALASAGFGGSAEPSAAVSWIKIALDVLLLLLAARQWRGLPKPGADAALPGWMSASAALPAGIVGTFVAAGSDRYAALTTAPALVTGAIGVAAGLARLGFLASLISEPVLKGPCAGSAGSGPERLGGIYGPAGACATGNGRRTHIG